ncbi:hypothetical protein E5Q_06682 [Mixia osmundae IAM 14324]|uniref:SGTA homodimerisation domain-containing protein n=2 Tax=Mixia osmundae (strain CBS 9802 / IAM 14324 / JCM 22182 / KY 12970) TaxID=764103 RepID=G7EAW9_MIXOS|nr:hypothetical protein E5Q_06682 [Mixia osmundae IAM 14324]
MDKKQRLVYSILDFLGTSLDDGSIKDDDREGIEVAMQCIGEAFSVDPSDAAQEAKYSIKPASLLQVLEIYTRQLDKTKGSAASSGATSTSGSATAAASAAPASTPASKAPVVDKAKADELKTKGNQAMAQKQYDQAIIAYSDAINIDGTNPVYYSNRAAAYSNKSMFDEAIEDATKASTLDPTFSKAYSRLGHALYSSGRFAEAVEAYESGLKLDPSNATMANSLQVAKSKVASEPAGYAQEDEDDISATAPAARAGAPNGMPDLSALLGGMGGGGGMPDIASMMQNPMMAQMAQRMMSDPAALQNLMSNPMIANMARQFGGGGGSGGAPGGGMPDMAAMMNDPTIRRMAEQFGRGAGRGAGGGSAGSSNSDNMYS